MKKILFITLIIFTSISCSKDNDNKMNENTTSKDPLIGTWTLSLLSNSPVNDCEKKTTYIFKEDFTFSYEEYRVNNGACSKSGNKKGEWKNKGNSTYYIKEHGYTSGAETKFTFTENNTVVKFANVTYKKAK